MEELKKCIITRYDETIEEPPFLTYEIDEIEVYKPIFDEYGSKFAQMLKDICSDLGYCFQFYTTAVKEGFDYEIVVY